jgi:hypothetical protein
MNKFIVAFFLFASILTNVFGSENKEQECKELRESSVAESVKCMASDYDPFFLSGLRFDQSRCLKKLDNNDQAWEKYKQEKCDQLVSEKKETEKMFFVSHF